MDKELKEILNLGERDEIRKREIIVKDEEKTKVKEEKKMEGKEI